MNKQKFHERRPYLFVALLEFAVIASAIAGGFMARILHLPTYAIYGITLFVMSVITLLVLWRMKWWKTIGFIGLKKKYFYLMIIPAVPMIGNLFGSYELLEFKFYIHYLMLTIMSGFVEEGIYRGLMFRALLEKGIWRAVLISSFIFSITHILNSLVGWNWQFVLLQLGYSFAIGFGWAAFVLRTGAIWPLMLIHFLVNFFSFIKVENLIKSVHSSQPSIGGIIYDIILMAVFICYGIVVVRAHVRSDN